MPHPDPAARFLPAGFPMPDREAMARLRENILKGTRTPHPPEPAELAAIITADEAGIQLDALGSEAIWVLSPDEREPLFQMLAKLLGEYGQG